MEYLPEALYRAADTRMADRRAAERYGLGGGLLMERAGAAAMARLRERFPRTRRLAVVCGPGNNGGDGYVLARLARDAGLHVEAFSPVDAAALKGDARTAWEHWRDSGGTTSRPGASAFNDYDVIVDALFGTGIEHPLTEPWHTIVEAINAASRPVLALDLPSGLHADSGRLLGIAVRAHVTVSFIGLKAGMFTGQGPEHCGLILFDDLQVPAGVWEGLTPLAQRLAAPAFIGLLAPRVRHAHKGMAGRVLVIGGQPGMPGATRLAGEAAYRTGAGLVTIATHDGHAAAISAACPELISVGVADAPALKPLLLQAMAVALGPGLGQSEWADALWRTALASERPLVVDADALNLLARQPRRCADWVLTPHPGEAARLLGTSVNDIEADRFAAARSIVERYGGVCVLKGRGTVIAADGQPGLWLCDRGNPGMATGGSGDVLTGAIAALLAQGLAPLAAAQLGVFVHATAGDQAACTGERGLRASDLLLPLRAALNELANGH